MGPLDLVLAPWRFTRAVARAADDLNALAERARRDPDPVEEIRVRLDALLAEIRALHDGGHDLRLTGESLDAHTVELISGGRELTEAAKVIAARMAVFEESLETVADTVEPLQGVANGVGRVTKRLSSSDG